MYTFKKEMMYDEYTKSGIWIDTKQKEKISIPNYPKIKNRLDTIEEQKLKTKMLVGALTGAGIGAVGGFGLGTNLLLFYEKLKEKPTRTLLATSGLGMLGGSLWSMLHVYLNEKLRLLKPESEYYLDIEPPIKNL